MFHAEATWTAGNGKMWLSDFLPKRLPDARILLFGYNSNVAVETSSAGVDEQAVNLLDRLTARRKLVSPRRRIIFIAHSLGGIVVKRALVEAKLDDKYASIRKATFGLVFFATPHHGGNFANLGDVAANIARYVLWNPKNTFVDNLKHNSIFSERLRDEFRHQLEDYKILSFYETKRLGPDLIVDAHSAILGLPGTRETAIALDGDHRSICKYPEPNAAYQQVEDGLAKLVEGALQTPVETVEGTLQLSEVHSPTFFVPYRKNPTFVGRENIIKHLLGILGPDPEGQRRAALYGLGGIGKTQIALSYAYRWKEEHPKTSVFWIHGSDLESFHMSFMDLADEMKIPGADSPKADILSLVRDWLSIKRNGGDWLMIVDNADDSDMFSKLPSCHGKGSVSGRLADYIPDCAHGAVLLTTRDLQVGIRMVHNVNSVLQVKRMGELEAIDMVQKILDDKEKYRREDISELAKKMEYIPLALAQAVAYIWGNSLPIQRYLTQYEKSRANELMLLRHNATNGLAKDEARNAVTTTWKISFAQIKQQNPLAANILYLFAFLDRHCIPDELIRRLYPSLLDMDFENACGLLKAFSLIEEIPLTLRGESHAAFTLHRMVQLVTQEWLQDAKETAVWAEQALVAVSIVFLPGEREEWKSCEIYLPHVKVVLESKVQSEDGNVSTSKPALLHNAATYFRVKGYHRRAEETAREAVAARQASIGSKHPDTLASHTSLSRVLLEQGRIEEAMELQLEAMKAAGSSIPENNPAMLRAVAYLAALHGIQGRFDEAERLQKHVLKMSEPLLGNDHPDVLHTLRDLAVSYGHRGRYDEAEKLSQLVLERRTRVLSEDHPETLISMLDLAATYMQQNSAPKAILAEEIERKVIEVRGIVLGKEHPATIQAMEHLRGTYEWQGRHDDAAKLQEQIKAINRNGSQQTAELSDAEKLNMSRNIVTYELPLRSNRTRRMSHDEDLAAVETTPEEEQEAEGPQIQARRSWVDANHAVDGTTKTEQVDIHVPNTQLGHHYARSMSSSASPLSSANLIPARDQAKSPRSSVGGFRSRIKSWQGESGEWTGKSEEQSRKKGWFSRYQT
ncbi:hypothetical protein PV04_06547 [Phialophora macrospora]|uniref:DUF676 domain-containing protein n=1 Tax=Phialophora macrospora TaxID=1851006 RepID=A0A0D2DYS1_9EURO|nr:hypothetical protein PV04_06547 [Phialophora macrospora]